MLILNLQRLKPTAAPGKDVTDMPSDSNRLSSENAPQQSGPSKEEQRHNGNPDLPEVHQRNSQQKWLDRFRRVLSKGYSPKRRGVAEAEFQNRDEAWDKTNAEAQNQNSTPGMLKAPSAPIPNVQGAAYRLHLIENTLQSKNARQPPLSSPVASLVNAAQPSRTFVQVNRPPARRRLPKPPPRERASRRTLPPRPPPERRGNSIEGPIVCDLRSPIRAASIELVNQTASNPSSTLVRAWILRRANPLYGEEKSWIRAIRVCIPTVETEQDLLAKRPRIWGKSVWDTLELLSTYQQQHIHRLLHDLNQTVLPTKCVEWALASISTSPKRAKTTQIMSLRVVLKRDITPQGRSDIDLHIRSWFDQPQSIPQDSLGQQNLPSTGVHAPFYTDRRGDRLSPSRRMLRRQRHRSRSPSPAPRNDGHRHKNKTVSGKAPDGEPEVNEKKRQSEVKTWLGIDENLLDGLKDPAQPLPTPPLQQESRDVVDDYLDKWTVIGRNNKNSVVGRNNMNSVVGRNNKVSGPSKDKPLLPREKVD